jgi:hypothetical protein
MRVLFASPMATRSGTPLLRPDFEALAPAVDWGQPLFQPLLKRLAARLGRGAATSLAGLLEAAVKRHKPDPIDLNTLATLSTSEAVARQLALSGAVVDCAEGVRPSLQTHPGLPLSRCTVIPEFVPFSAPGQAAAAEPVAPPEGNAHHLLQERLEVAHRNGTFVFGFAGQAIARKGFDLFPQLVREWERVFAGAPFLAVWPGAAPAQEQVIVARRDLRLMQLLACMERAVVAGAHRG